MPAEEANPPTVWADQESERIESPIQVEEAVAISDPVHTETVVIISEEPEEDGPPACEANLESR